MGLTNYNCAKKEWETLCLCKSQKGQRDHYPLPIIDHVLERVARKKAYSFLDGFSGYNQLSTKIEEQHKIFFAMEWVIFGYKFMPFGLTNALTSFWCLMSHSFKDYP